MNEKHTCYFPIAFIMELTKGTREEVQKAMEGGLLCYCSALSVISYIHNTREEKGLLSLRATDVVKRETIERRNKEKI